MRFTTTTEIARKGSKIFKEWNETIVLNNNRPLWALLSYKLYEKLKEKGYIDKIKKEIENDEKEYLVWLENTLKEWDDDMHDNLFA